MRTNPALTVHCPLCPDFGPVEAADLLAGFEVAGAHDDAHHDGGTAAYVHAPQED